MAEYLHYQEPDWLQYLTLDEMLKASRAIAPAVLRLDILPAAKSQLLDTPGPNWDRRQVLGSVWMDNICDYLSKFADDGGLYSHNFHLVELSKLRTCLDVHRANDKTSGTLFIATGEANLGHVWAYNWMSRHVAYPVGLFEPDSYFDANPTRRKPFLPLKVRLSVATHYNLYTSVLDDRTSQETDQEYYQRMFNLSGADYCFATEDDPHLREKIQRGKIARFLVIPNLEYPHTSEAAQKLMPDLESLF